MSIIIRSVGSEFLIEQNVSVNNFTTVPIYGTIEQADNYFSLMLHGMRWGDTSHDQKFKALVSATKLIETLNFAGYKASDIQPLQFPRGTDTLVPVAIEEATYELALVLLRGINPDTERENLFKNVQVYGTVRAYYDRTVVPMHTVHGIPSPRAWQLLLPFLEGREGLSLRRGD